MLLKKKAGSKPAFFIRISSPAIDPVEKDEIRGCANDQPFQHVVQGTVGLLQVFGLNPQQINIAEQLIEHAEFFANVVL